MRPLITIATVTFNCLPYTRLFLESLKNFADIPYKLIIVDNHSTDGTTEFLSCQKDLEMKIIFNKRNLGFGWANNQAFRLSDTPYFLGLNNDTFIFPGFLKILLRTIKENPSFAELGVNSNCIGAVDPRTGKDTRWELDKLKKAGYSPGKIIKIYYKNYHLFFRQFFFKNKGILDMEVPPNFIGGWCFLVKRELVKKAGGLFDTRFKIGFWEDVDLSWRLAKLGYKIGLLKGVYLHHFNHISFVQNKLRYKDKTISRKNALRFAEKWNEEIKNFLKLKFNQHFSLKEIVNKYFIFQAFFGKNRKDFSALEKRLKNDFLKGRLSFKDFLSLKSYSQKNYSEHIKKKG